MCAQAGALNKVVASGHLAVQCSARQPSRHSPESPSGSGRGGTSLTIRPRISVTICNELDNALRRKKAVVLSGLVLEAVERKEELEGTNEEVEYQKRWRRRSSYGDTSELEERKEEVQY